MTVLAIIGAVWVASFVILTIGFPDVLPRAFRALLREMER